MNPFQSQGQNLICLSTGKVATEDVARDLQAKFLGEIAYRKFSEEKLEANPPKVRFHDTMSKAKLKTFSHMNKSGAPKKEPPKRLYLRPTVHCLHRWLLSQRQGNSARKRCSPIHWVRYLGLWPLLMAP